MRKFRTQVSGFRSQPSRKGFTLIELLVVIAIILILVGMVLVAISKIKRAANRRRASTEMAAIANAVKAYNVAYGKWPGQAQGSVDLTYYNGDGGTEDQCVIMNALTNTALASANPRDELFIEIPPKSLGPDGRFIDPWKRPYIIVMDENKSGTLDVWCRPVVDGQPVPEVKFVSTKGVRGKVAVVSLGEDPADTDLSTRVYSWKTIYLKQ